MFFALLYPLTALMTDLMDFAMPLSVQQVAGEYWEAELRQREYRVDLTVANRVTDTSHPCSKIFHSLTPESRLDSQTRSIVPNDALVHVRNALSAPDSQTHHSSVLD